MCFLVVLKIKIAYHRVTASKQQGKFHDRLKDYFLQQQTSDIWHFSVCSPNYQSTPQMLTFTERTMRQERKNCPTIEEVVFGTRNN